MAEEVQLEPNYEEDLDETNKEIEEETEEEIEEETDEDGKMKKIVEITQGPVDWDLEEANEKQEEKEKKEAEQKELDLEKTQEQKELEKLDPITRIKLKHSYKDEERTWILDKAKIDGITPKEVMANKEVQDLIQYRRKMQAPKTIPNVLEKTSEDQYLTGFEWKKKYPKLTQ